jgi:hypothetical protein
MNNINYHQNYNIYNKNNGIFNINRINYNKNHNIYMRIIIFLILILLIIIKIIIFWTQIIIFFILIIILNLCDQSFYSNTFLKKKLLTINDNNNNNNNNNCYYFFFHFSSLKGLQTQSHRPLTPRGATELRCMSEETTAGGSAPSTRVCKPQACRSANPLTWVCSLTMPNQTICYSSFQGLQPHHALPNSTIQSEITHSLQ